MSAEAGKDTVGHKLSFSYSNGSGPRCDETDYDGDDGGKTPQRK